MQAFKRYLYILSFLLILLINFTGAIKLSDKSDENRSVLPLEGTVWKCEREDPDYSTTNIFLIFKPYGKLSILVLPKSVELVIRDSFSTKQVIYTYPMHGDIITFTEQTGFHWDIQDNNISFSIYSDRYVGNIEGKLIKGFIDKSSIKWKASYFSSYGHSFDDYYEFLKRQSIRDIPPPPQ
jgi:hypothetical protein